MASDAVVNFENEFTLGTSLDKTITLRVISLTYIYSKNIRLFLAVKASGDTGDTRDYDITINDGKGNTYVATCGAKRVKTDYLNLTGTATNTEDYHDRVYLYPFSYYGELDSNNKLKVPTIKIKCYRTRYGVAITDFETTVTITDLATIDYSAPTCSLGSATTKTDKSELKAYNVAMSHSSYGFERYSLKWQGSKGSYMQTFAVNTSDTSISFAEVDANSSANQFVPGETCTVTLTVTCENGQTASASVTFTVPVMVTAVEVDSPGSLEVGTDAQLVYRLIGENGLTPNITTVTFESANTSIATISSTGLISPVSPGNARITVTSDDTDAGSPSVSIMVAVGTGGFPAFLDEYDRLDKPLMDSISAACIYLAAELSVTITALSDYNGYSTWLKDIQPTLDAVNGNVKTLCAAASVSETLPASFPFENNGEVWFSIVNQWIDKLQAINNSL